MRKASDVILDLENKLNKVLQKIDNISFTQNIILNKLNQSQKNEITKPQPQLGGVFAEAADVKSLKAEPTRSNTISVSDNNVSVDNFPVGHRRTSRHENYIEKNVQTNDEGFSNQIQIPHVKGSQVLSNNVGTEVEPPQELDVIKEHSNLELVPVVQRVVDGNGKSVFMADVQILQVPGLERKAKIRTGGTGKWSSTLAPGKYRALIKKRDRITKQDMQTTFDFIVNNEASTLELDTLIFNNK